MDAAHDKICQCERCTESLGSVVVANVPLGSVPRHVTLLLINRLQKLNNL